MKIALVHDHLAQDGGAESVLKVFHELWPEAPIFVLLHDTQSADPIFSKANVQTSFIQHLPLGVKKYKWYLPLMPVAVEHFDLSAFDVVISSSASLAKGVLTSPHTLHICYCHTPTRYLWTDTKQYVQELAYNRFMKKVIACYLSFLRIWDLAAADRVDIFLANSKIVKQRIKKYYKRESTVIYPPVDLSQFRISTDEKDNYFLIGGRLVPYKRYDIAIQAFNAMKRRLKVFGSGPDEQRLKKLAGDTIEFEGRVSDEQLAVLYQKAQALIFPQEEDLGIIPIEAMASGTPVIAYQRGGVTETVIQGKTGTFFEDQNWQSLTKAVLQFHPGQFDPKVIRAHVEQFSVERFKKEIQQFVEEAWKQWERKSHIQ
ncbi:MAG: hypothetical protein A3B74_04935 [Candidatus Kerfeldbacteria bacterium RIFCSPHIGHO2_02_FULL_42_14]|uniref:Glycosyl transferase family 1 domain-containing protein n=1 Tax=Candidatus Kerfeldbacteria bacterium RIFCSPHIGHO2_02_FULL_42_14 TaxID=1798540 RepID=A0A1G2AP96_9BACT|nr:MAG: hypothetical protein A3B74_04935 [Candidatus Kerfeldbacteria bacterium RIFCSPHIGHO2_02_FULL_42_14]OGY81073.1 MAG: hypothetical protein A3E60_03655 [Candidatus Kerfeldbacteria bacterium RIFCSPHIGHO2_12_FULL_42_13]OGY84890.1 MAG: hypothetical protein A3I91_05300 [Candidatus Kerfeldbacteria bacterium RIFCSPLOWO2_02_FULL_42_19]OGY86798.1 MAG: hypothetical protein A3G01_02600 [Candidatus Kerfeldbacteria bacterium RIFCSPLOWO2_12_FULL_43_9]